MVEEMLGAAVPRGVDGVASISSCSRASRAVSIMDSSTSSTYISTAIVSPPPSYIFPPVGPNLSLSNTYPRSNHQQYMHRRLSLIARTMSTNSSASHPQPAPWRASFLEHVSKMDSPEFVFSSLHAAPPDSPTPYLPRARYCIYRGLWATLPDNKHNDAPMNDRVYETDMPTFTTDVRMLKVPELFGSGPGHAERKDQTLGSGGGGPVEAVWWVKDTMTQWRVKGEAFVVGPDIDDDTESSGVRTVKSELGKRMRVVKPEGQGEWSWAKELTAHFGNISPGMRGELALACLCVW